MSQKWSAGNQVRQTYDTYAAAYEDFNHGYMYERWTGRLFGKAEEAGLTGNRLLDVACGTGLSFVTLLERGWEVTGCDISPEMLAIAEEKFGARADLFVADMRELPDLGGFDLIWAVNDPLNYLLSIEELEATLDGMRRNLAPAGIALFDINTLVTYRTFFSREVVVNQNGRQLVWQGRLSPDEVAPGVFAEASFEEVGSEGSAHVHRQRHFSQDEVLACFERVGLESIAVYGEQDGALTPGVDENLHTKAVYLARLP
ncbi:MAG TPA: class I SAM-dependent methyltransferase [Solirubrobacterales bacterium]|nr:class I SAM-dependent methyltransferase [Solirubrobacterales bacterium]